MDQFNFDTYPNTDFNKINLDWMLEQFPELDARIRALEAGGGGAAGDSVFRAVYGTTSFTDIQTALSNNLLPYLEESGLYYTLLGASAFNISFMRMAGSIVYVAICNDTNGWTKYQVEYVTTQSPHFSGIPTAPTAPAGTNSWQLATTAFVHDIVSSALATKYDFVTEAYINTSGSSVTGPFSNSNYAYSRFAVSPGEIISIKGYGASAARLYAFLDNADNVISRSGIDLNTNGDYITVIAPDNAVECIVNVRVANDYDVRGDNDCHVYSNALLHNYGRVVIATKKYTWANNFVVTCAIPTTIKGVYINNPDIKVAFVKIRNGEIVGFDYWRRQGDTYIFDYESYTEYAFYCAYEDESIIENREDALSNIYLWGDETEFPSLDDDLNAITRPLKKNAYLLEYANAVKPIPFKSHLGNTFNVHPDVKYIPDGFGGHKYWMAYTPYPFSLDAYENPCVAYSNDGVTWYNISGNPINVPQSGYNSDTCLVYRDDIPQLELWYRYVSDTTVTPVSEIIYRSVSADGKTWSNPQAVRTNTGTDYALYLSPSVVWDGSKYIIFVVTATTGAMRVFTATDATITSWTFAKSITPSYKDGNNNTHKAWHVSVILDNSQYVCCMMAKTIASASENKWSTFLFTVSLDYNTVSVPAIILDAGTWDKYQYRASIVKTSDGYYIYYSAGSAQYTQSALWGIGITCSNTLSNFIGFVDYYGSEWAWLPDYKGGYT